MRRQIQLKSKTCTERVHVDAAGISVNAGAHYPGRSGILLQVLLSSRGDGKKCQKSAEGIVGCSTQPKVRTCNQGERLKSR